MAVATALARAVTQSLGEGGNQSLGEGGEQSIGGPHPAGIFDCTGIREWGDSCDEPLLLDLDAGR